MALHHRVSKQAIEAELNRLLRGEAGPPLVSKPPPEVTQAPLDGPQAVSLLPELITTLLLAAVLAVVLGGLKLASPRLNFESRGLELLQRSRSGG